MEPVHNNESENGVFTSRLEEADALSRDERDALERRDRVENGEEE
jgi:hypothetical protein